MTTVLAWLRRHDPGWNALRRAARTAVVMPAMFAVGLELLDNLVLATFAAFGCFAMLLLADFSGPMRDRVLAQVTLVLAGSVLVCLGTLLSSRVWLATIGMLVVGFAALFAGVVSSVVAGATLSVLLAFVLPVTLIGPPSSIPDRVSGWLLAGAASVLAVRFLWPAPVREPLRDAAAEACAKLAARLQLRLSDDADDATRQHAEQTATDAVEDLRQQFFASAYRPTGLSTEDRAIVRLVDEILWLDAIFVRLPARGGPVPVDAAVHALKVAAGVLLEHTAKALGAGQDPDDELSVHLDDLAAARARMEQAVAADLPADGVPISALEPSFRAQELSFAIRAIAANVEAAVAARRRTWWQRLLGRQPEGLSGPLASFVQRAGAHVERHSVWLHNSVRGAVGLAAAVLVADVSGVQHSFWVVLGTVSVLRSNALNTGQNALRGLLGTAVGFVVGGALIVVLGTNTTVLWFLLPVAILIAGVAPAVSFAAGQAGFTMTLLILFNILQPTGWQVGLVRIEDVAIGFSVSLVVGALFWPRGAAASLAQSLAEAYVDSARLLRGTVGAQLHCDDDRSRALAPASTQPRAADAARRLDDAFRTFLAERGTKHLTLAQVAALTTGVAGLRLTAAAVAELWAAPGPVAPGESDSRAALIAETDDVAGWYVSTAHALTGDGDVPDAVGADGRRVSEVTASLAEEVRRVPDDQRRTLLRVVWTCDHIDAARRLQSQLVEPARAAATYRHRRHPMLRWWYGRPARRPSPEPRHA